MTAHTNGIPGQRLRALEQANRVRLARAALKHRIAKGELEAGEVLLMCPREAASMAIGELLLAQRRWGPSRCHRFLLPISIGENKTIGSMTERQRRSVAALLAMRVTPREDSGPVTAARST